MDSPRFAVANVGEKLCWTRMQAEAGQPLDQIIRRKEMERLAGGGLFFWGVGNAPSRAIAELALKRAAIPVAFSVMKTPAKTRDANAPSVVLWRRYVDTCGTIRSLPPHSIVTSRASARNYHFALVCYSDEPLTLGNLGMIDSNALRNVSEAGRKVGSSQVTALVQRHAHDRDCDYHVAMQARLTGGYWVKLIDPLRLVEEDLRVISHLNQSSGGWREVSEEVRKRAESRQSAITKQWDLFSPSKVF